LRPSGLFHFCLSILVPLRNRDFSPMPVKTRLNSGAVHANPYIERACCRPQRPQIPIMSSQCHRHQSYGIGWPKNTFNDCGLLAKSPYIIGSRHAHCFAIPWRVVKLRRHQIDVPSLGLPSKAPMKFRCDGRILPLFAQDCLGDLGNGWLSSPRSLLLGFAQLG